jgi:hypothetical protein
MFKEIITNIQNKSISNGTRAPRPRWLLPAVVLLSVAVLSGSAILMTNATVQTYSLWSNATTPRTINQYDPHAVELGLKFQTKITGQVTGLKFYKSKQNTGTHIGNLWDKRGKKLASVTFKNETKSGWQTASFDTPVTIAADTTYIVSYFAPEGHFSIDSRYFAKTSHVSGPLTALKSGTDGANGVYSYGFRSSFPSDDSNKDNYWVDVLFKAESGVSAPVPTSTSLKAIDSANSVTDPTWFTKAYAAGFRLYVMHTTNWGTCDISPQAQPQLKMALDAGLKIAAYTRDPNCWKNGILAAGPYQAKLQFFGLDAEKIPGIVITRDMVNGVKSLGVRPVIYTGSHMWPALQTTTASDFTDVPLWDTDTTSFDYGTWTANYLAPTPVAYGGWNTKANMRVGVQQEFEYLLNGVNVDLNSFDASFLSDTPTKPIQPTPTPTSTPTSPTPSAPQSTTGRSYPLHTNINSTTYWVGEQFQATADGSQVCSAYDSQWQYSFFHVKTGTNTASGCQGAPTGGCDALLKTPGAKCDDINSVASLRTPANGYFPTGLPQIYESPFYLDLPYDDYNQSNTTDTTGYATRCQDVPWANDPGFAGNCTNQAFSYMKNRFVKIMANGKTCYGQIEDAGPADDGHGNGNYADAAYVFGTNDARPYNKSYNSAGMDVSPALGACLGGTFNTDLTVNWQFVDNVDVPAGPWKTIVTTTKPN